MLPRIVAAGTPPVTQATFIYGDDALAVQVKPRDGVKALFAPRRTVLDRAIVDVAIESGVQAVYGTRVVDLQRRYDGRVTGAWLANQEDAVRVVQAPLVIGADGLRSQVARLVAAPTTRVGAVGHRQCIRVLVRPAGGRLSLVLFTRAERWRDSDQRRVHLRVRLYSGDPVQRDLQARRRGRATGRCIEQAGTDLAEGMRHGRLESPLHGFPGQPGFFRRSAGPGWALIGDAGYFKDPLTAHGITDALIEAEYLARAVQAGTDAALMDYEAGRDATDPGAVRRDRSHCLLHLDAGRGPSPAQAAVRRDVGRGEGPERADPRGGHRMTLRIGQTATRSLTLTDEHVRKYAEISGDYNPLHFDAAFAAGTRFGRLVVQGGLTTGLLHALAAMDLPGPGTVFLSQNWKFTAPVYIGDTITAHGEITRVHDSKPVSVLGVRVTRQTGEVVLEGEAWCYTFTGGDHRPGRHRRAPQAYRYLTDALKAPAASPRRTRWPPPRSAAECPRSRPATRCPAPGNCRRRCRRGAG